MTPGPGIFRTKLPEGFTAGGVNCGVRIYRPDLGVIIADEPCVVVGVFTKSSCKAAPVKYCESILPANNIRAIMTNSGEANAATGNLGIENNQKMVNCLAKTLGCQSEQILTASTGIIGKQLSIDKILAAIPSLVASTTNIAEKFALAILTTDLVPKTVYKEVQLSAGKVRITGICKGSGMIHPNMATMLGYFLTDLQIDRDMAQTMLKNACDQSFNMISVDGETSTNDCAFLFASGKTGVTIQNDLDAHLFYTGLLEIAIVLAKSIARDGEGASKLIQVEVTGAQNESQAKQIAKSIVTSPLIKTAVYGESPNWGRIIARIGSEPLEEEMLAGCEIFIQGIKLFTHGAPVASDVAFIKEKLKEDTTEISIQFAQGSATATAWGCDLTEKYVKINAEYV